MRMILCYEDISNEKRGTTWRALLTEGLRFDSLRNNVHTRGPFQWKKLLSNISAPLGYSSVSEECYPVTHLWSI
ncbi:hypothetical protein Plhal304r1_c021g0075651 [Plasmopara halstedii]